MYQSDYAGEMPPTLTALVDNGYLNIGGTLRDVIESGRIRETILICLSSGDNSPDPSDVDSALSYYFARILRQPSEAASSVPILWDRKTWHHGGRWQRWFGPPGVNVLYADYHVEFTTLEDLESLLEKHAALYETPPVMPEVVEE
ncbi:MAG: hypothetical protein ACYTAN_18535 [Planctomycetota bacterium]|jgi:hypothetical protein